MYRFRGKREGRKTEISRELKVERGNLKGHFLIICRQLFGLQLWVLVQMDLGVSVIKKQ